MSIEFLDRIRRKSLHSKIMTAKRWPYQTGKVVQKQVNNGTMKISNWE